MHGLILQQCHSYLRQDILRTGRASISTTCTSFMPAKKKGTIRGFEDPMSVHDEAIEVENKQNFGNLRLYNKRHLREHKRGLSKKFPEYCHHYGVRPTGVVQQGGYSEEIPEMTPELVVPDLTDFKLKPYVSYRTKEIFQEPFTAKDLFNVVYGRKILKDYKEGKLDDKGDSLEPSEEELMTADTAIMNARKTGSDIFSGGEEKSKLWKLNYDRGIKKK